LNCERSWQKIHDSFKINENGRPEGTQEIEEGIIHYTCNPPKAEIIEKYGILPIGRMFGVEKNEVLIIGKQSFLGINDINTIEVENFLRRIDLEGSD
jgi:hypothetical protein